MHSAHFESVGIVAPLYQLLQRQRTLTLHLHSTSSSCFFSQIYFILSLNRNTTIKKISSMQLFCAVFFYINETNHKRAKRKCCKSHQKMLVSFSWKFARDFIDGETLHSAQCTFRLQRDGPLSFCCNMICPNDEPIALQMA